MKLQFEILISQIKKYAFWIIFSFLLEIISIVAIKYYNNLFTDIDLYVNLLIGIIDIDKYDMTFFLLMLYDLIFIIYIIMVTYYHEFRISSSILLRIKDKKFILNKILVGIIFLIIYKTIKILIVLISFPNVIVSYIDIINIFIYYLFVIFTIYIFMTMIRKYYLIPIILFIFYIVFKYFNLPITIFIIIVEFITIIRKFNIKKYLDS